MENQEILNALANVKKGRYVSIKKVKDLGKGVTKVSDIVVRLGVDFANMKINEGRQTGSLPWGKWVEGLEGLVIEHKGNYYLRVATTYGNNNTCAYYLDGKEVTKEQVIALIGEKKLAGGNPDVYNIRFENILALNIG